MGFVPLQVVSSYSLLKSTISIDRLVNVAKQRGYRTLALTDNNVMYGAVEFYNACRNAEMKAIIGMNVSLAGIVQPLNSFPVTLLAQNQNGYQNLMRISTLIQTAKTNNLISVNQIGAFLKDLFVILPNNGELINLLGNNDAVANEINIWCQYVDLNNLKLAITSTLPSEIVSQIRSVGAQYHLNLVGIDPVEYIDSEDYFAKQVLGAIGDSNSVNFSPAKQNQTGKNWLKPLEMVEREYHLRGLESEMEQTQLIADHCEVKIEKKPTQLPTFPTPEGQSSKQYLELLCQSGLKSRFDAGHIDKERFKDYQQRLDHELSVIIRMGFADYFLIVWDVINYAHSVGITTGPGRGSAAGSLVSYVLSITDVDPIQYDLLFERFLNEERAQMPDIDLDIPDDRRDEILNYVHDKYGNDRVAQIITFDTFGAKQVLKDINRTFGVSNDHASQWSKAIPSEVHISLRSAYEKSQGLRNIVNTSSLNRLIYETALKLEGLPRHFSTHAAGVILSNQPLVNTTPLQNGKNNILMTQYSKNYAEEVGLLKIDFLGLRNLSFLASIIDLIHRTTDPNFDIHQININDAKTLQLFQNGDTNGIFQFESSGIKNVLRQVKPTDFNLVAVVNALYRPGPMQNINEFVARKNGKKTVAYPDRALAPILGPTYGIIVYQEQVMQVASVMGGFTLGQSDVLRRAMSKKKQSVMDSMRVKFISGAKQRGFTPEVANITFDYIDRFASYGFNKSHAVAYSKMAFQLAYLKVHYPLQFFTTIFNAEMGNKAKTRTFLLEAKSHQIEILAPNINLSNREFSLQDGKIVFGLAAVRTVRSDLITNIVSNREQGGIFTNLHNFLSRLDSKFLKPALIEPLIYAGALDCFNLNRSELIASLNEFIQYLKLSGGSTNLLDTLAPIMKHRDEFSMGELLENEQKYLGVYLSSFPTEQFAAVSNQFQTKHVNDLPQYINQSVNILVFVNQVRTIRTKKGDPMAFVNGSDPIGEVDIVVFPKVYRQVKAHLVAQRVLLINGRVDLRNGEQLQLIANQIQSAANVQSDLNHRPNNNKPAGICFLRINSENNQMNTLNQLNQLIKSNPGPYRVVLYWAEQNKRQLLNPQFSLSDDGVIQSHLRNLLGNQNVVYQKR